MTDQRQPSGEQEFAEEQASLVRITFGPLVWALHFVASYAATAVFCAKLPRAIEHIEVLRWGILGATVLADIYPDRAVEAAIVWTDGPRLMPVPRDLMRAAFAT